MSRHPRVRIVAVLAFAWTAALFVSRIGVDAQRLRPFFSEQSSSSETPAVTRSAGSRIKRRRLARADLGQLTAVDRASGLPVGNATSIALNLFDDVAYVAQLERTDEVGSGAFAWVGSLIGAPEGRAILAVANGVLAGSVTTQATAYEIRWQPGDVYEIAEIDRTRFKQEAPPLHGDSVIPAAAADQPATAQDDGSVFDLLVAYTPAARASLGGTAAMSSLIALGVSESNQAYNVIGLGSRVRLVGTYEWNHVETEDSSSELAEVRTSMDVATQRDALGADLVLLLVNNLETCGRAYILDSLSTSFSPFAYAVVDRSCVSPNYSFAHELGHNMGSDHAPEDNPTAGVFFYSAGYKDDAGGFRTIMAYDCPFGCRRILTFSSPRNIFNGRVTGRSMQDNARSLASTRTIVANFRPSAATGLSAPGPPTSLTTSSSGSSVALQWVPGNGGPPNAYIIEAGSSSGLANLASFNTGTTATSFATPGVAPGVYYVRIRATNSAGTSGPSNESILAVGGVCGGAPGAPGALIVASNSAGTVALTWSAPVGVPTTYLLEAGSSPGTSDLAHVDLSGTATTSTAIGVARGTYYVRIRARNACGTSGPSNEIVVIV